MNEQSTLPCNVMDLTLGPALWSQSLERRRSDWSGSLESGDSFLKSSSEFTPVPITFPGNMPPSCTTLADDDISSLGETRDLSLLFGGSDGLTGAWGLDLSMPNAVNTDLALSFPDSADNNDGQLPPLEVLGEINHNFVHAQDGTAELVESRKRKRDIAFELEGENLVPVVDAKYAVDSDDAAWGITLACCVAISIQLSDIMASEADIQSAE